MISVFITIFYHILNKCTFYHDFYCPVVTFDLPLPTNELCVTPHDSKIDGRKILAKTLQKKKKERKKERKILFFILHPLIICDGMLKLTIQY